MTAPPDHCFVVMAYGDSPFLGSEAAAGLNGKIIGAFGF